MAARRKQVAEEYERGHAAPFSPETPETAGAGTPAVREARRRSLSEDAPEPRKARARAAATRRPARR